MIIPISGVLIAVLSIARARSTMVINMPKQMNAVGLYKYLPITDPNSLQDLKLEVPALQINEILVKVKAIAVNPIDVKQRAPQLNVETKPKILGWDGSGIVVATGENAYLFKIGDEVFFTGDLRRNGSNAEYVALDQNLVGTKPKTLTFEEAAALPLTAVTAYESLFDRLALTDIDKGKTLLIINNAGGVGNIASQLAKNFGLKVIGTEARQVSFAFSKKYGADLVLNNTQNLISQLEANGYANRVDLILVNNDPAPDWDTLTEAIKPQGKICLIVDNRSLVYIPPLKEKGVKLVFEMILRIKYDKVNKFTHHEILQKVSKLVEEGKLKHTLTKTLSPINAANLREAHRLIEEKRMIGKLVLTVF